jgi:hypothetical protein
VNKPVPCPPGTSRTLVIYSHRNPSGKAVEVVPQHQASRLLERRSGLFVAKHHHARDRSRAGLTDLGGAQRSSTGYHDLVADHGPSEY